MTAMYFFIYFLFYQQLIYALKQPSIPVPGKYQIVPTDKTGICQYNHWMSSSTYSTGIDYRFPHDENDSYVSARFAELFKKKDILDYLQNERESTINKHLLLEEYNKNYTDSNYDANVFAGDLMADWEANIE